MDEKYDEMNEKFLSSNIDDLISFYNFFHNRKELVDWMQHRPKSEPTIHRVSGENDIVVVIPTADANSKRLKLCSERIFSGLNQIIVESVKPLDKYFNYSHNVNIGVSEAIKTNPKWIIISNDDMVPGDPPHRLISEIRSHDSDLEYALFTRPEGEYHSFQRFIGQPNMLYSIATKLHPNRYRSIRFSLWKRFDLRYIDALYRGSSGLLSRLTYKTLKVHLLTGSFTILSRNYIQSHKQILDETFINGGEDSDLSLRLHEDLNKIGYIDYKIGDRIGTSLGSGWARIIRNVVNEIYLSYKIEKGLLRI